VSTNVSEEHRLHLQGRRNKFSKKPASKQVESLLVPPKRRLALNGLRGVISRKMVLFNIKSGTSEIRVRNVTELLSAMELRIRDSSEWSKDARSLNLQDSPFGLLNYGFILQQRVLYGISHTKEYRSGLKSTTPCGLIDGYGLFRRVSYLHLQSRRVSQRSSTLLFEPRSSHTSTLKVKAVRTFLRKIRQLHSDSCENLRSH
jgi:hypothetical protein